MIWRLALNSSHLSINSSLRARTRKLFVTEAPCLPHMVRIVRLARKVSVRTPARTRGDGRRETMGECIGEAVQVYGRWIWPIKMLQPGDYFQVDHALKPPQEVGHYVNVRSSQLGIPLSFQMHDPDRPGFCRVTRRNYADMPEVDGTEMDYEKVHDKLSLW